jgi:hypothetical protein
MLLALYLSTLQLYRRLAVLFGQPYAVVSHGLRCRRIVHPGVRVRHQEFPGTVNCHLVFQTNIPQVDPFLAHGKKPERAGEGNDRGVGHIGDPSGGHYAGRVMVAGDDEPDVRILFKHAAQRLVVLHHPE